MVSYAIAGVGGSGGTAATVWYSWSGSGSATTTTASTAWGAWNIATPSVATAMTTGPCWGRSKEVTYANSGSGSSQAYQPVQETPEEAEARECIDRERIKAERIRFEKERKEKELANKKADELLVAHLNDDQRQQYGKEKKFKVMGGDGASFELDYKRSGNAREFDKDNRPIARFCIHPREDVPIPDQLLAQKLMLETDPASFRKIANRTPIEAPR